MLRLDKDGKIRYNYLQLAGTHKALRSSWKQQIKETQNKDPDYKDYKEKETTYIPKKIAKEFITKFYKGIT